MCQEKGGIHVHICFSHLSHNLLKEKEVFSEVEIYLEGAPVLKEVSMTYQIWFEYCYVKCHFKRFIGYVGFYYQHIYFTS